MALDLSLMKAFWWANLALSASGLSTSNLAEIRSILNKLDLIINFSVTLKTACDCSFLYWHQSYMLPIYFSKLISSKADLARYYLILNGLTDCATTTETEVTEVSSKIIKDNFFTSLDQIIETNLRLQTHLHLQLPPTDPFQNYFPINFHKYLPVPLDKYYKSIKNDAEHYLSTMFYNLTTVVLHDWKTYGEMRRLAYMQYGLETVDDNLPMQTLEQGLDVLEIMRNINVFVSKYLYNLNSQVFIEESSNNKHLNSINISHVANSIRTHGIGIMNTTVNFTYQFLRSKFYIFSQFMFDEHIKSRLLKDLRYFSDHKNELTQMYPYERAEKFNISIKKLGLNQHGESYLDLFRKLITHIGNAMGYIRLIRSGGRRCLADGTCFIPELKDIQILDDIVKEEDMSDLSNKSATCLCEDLHSFLDNIEDATEYFKLLVKVFVPVLRSSNNVHLNNFYIIVPPLTINFIEHSLNCKEKLNKKNKANCAFTDDGFALVLWELLQSKHEELGILDHAVYDLMLDSAAEAELESEIEARDAYLKKFTTLKVRYEKLFDDAEMAKAESSRSSSTGQGLHINETTGKRKFKLPPLEFKHYDGSIKDWLAFWSQFKKIHEDESIDDHDKIEYLIQATVAGSKARQLVESYPAMSENYQKIISSMLSRFGREDLQIEVYVREVLKLILTNAASQQKMEIATLHDQIETQLRALETLGITSDKCSALLYPLIESCLPHELLRAWQRSASFSKCEPEDVSNGSSTCTLEIRLKKLMAFLKHEVENEQRITLASEGFGLSERKVHAKPSTKKQGDIPTATGLINHEVSGCIFCSSPHDSNLCFKAQKMSLEQKRNALSGKKACFRCLKPGHQSKKCRGRLKCIVCSRSHATLMCPEISANKKLDNKPPDNNGSNVQEETERDRVLANNTRTQILLQTVRVTLKGIYRSKMVRALFDTGSQRSYVLSETANELGYPPKRAEKVVHCLFGGKELSNAHNCYDVTISNGKHSYTFEALDQPVICNDVAPVSYGPWMKEMADLGIEISDVRDHGPIELLLGADIVGSLYTGLRRELPCGLIAMETHIGWTLMGKIHTRKAHSDLVMTTLNLFVKDASISDLWELEALGIKEPSDKHTKEEMAMAAKDLFYETVKTQPDGRYEVRLPWHEDHPLSQLTTKWLKKVAVSYLQTEEGWATTYPIDPLELCGAALAESEGDGSNVDRVEETGVDESMSASASEDENGDRVRLPTEKRTRSGLAYIIELLNQESQLNSLHWFHSVQRKFKNDRLKIKEQAVVTNNDDPKLTQTLTLTHKRIVAFERVR
ncbi:hypothetical protein NQ318_015510 [Aromia moschata]|uniref:CCHC-type domain-containing protein n=1 Tax=Aromia moschata TaxID=1265417 RepID=A0AAV8XQ60_9CUCU|nr:hypothetical protein NQ318_015510 [Aromia moschata]